ncbi:hypothetical protein ASF34_03195 [Methylobacterium sp. Leaf106]|nr:hypothetical protein ASF34_03195 [Methylobacterium sp. Leaf106]
MRTITGMHTTMRITATQITATQITAMPMCMAPIASTITEAGRGSGRRTIETELRLFHTDTMTPSDIRFSVAPMMDWTN